MNFQTLPQITQAQNQLDNAFYGARNNANKIVFKKGVPKNSKIRKKEIFKIEYIQKQLCGTLRAILKKYPTYEEMDEFHRKLMETYIDIDSYRQDLSKVKFAEKKIREFSKRFKGMIKATNELEHIQNLSKEFYGRVSSIYQRIKPPLDRLEGFRRKLKSLPDVKDNCVNIALFGFPNVGKSTILSKITSAKPEIASYAFTTKKINIGYKEMRNIKIQIFDTPGTLNRFEKMNDIEKMAYLVISKLADLVIYVFDPSYTYSIEKQNELFKISKELNNNVIPMITKTDIVEKEEVEKLKTKFSAITYDDLESIFKKEVIKWELKKLKENNNLEINKF